jgi:hypothetical protein
MAVIAGGGFSPEDRAELLTILAGDPDENIKERAANALLSVPVESFLAAMKRPDASPRVIQYCAENLANKPGMADALAQNTRTPHDLLVKLAPQLSSESVQALLNDLDRLTHSPVLGAALSMNPNLTVDQKRTLEDLQKDDEGIDEEAMREALASIEPDAQKRETLIQRLNKMRVVDRIKLALTGNREERITLIRDPNKLVQRAVLQSPKLTEQEVENFAGMANLNEEILRVIAGNRQFIKNYNVVKRLVNNPKVPLDITLHLMPRLNMTDIKFLTMNKNIPETLRNLAFKLMRERKASSK